MSGGRGHAETSGVSGDAAPTGTTARLRRAFTPMNVLVVVVFSVQPYAALLAANRTQIHDTGKIVAFAVVTALAALALFSLIVAWRPRLVPGSTAVAVGI